MPLKPPGLALLLYAPTCVFAAANETADAAGNVVFGGLWLLLLTVIAGVAGGYASSVDGWIRCQLDRLKSSGTSRLPANTDAELPPPTPANPCDQVDRPLRFYLVGVIGAFAAQTLAVILGLLKLAPLVSDFNTIQQATAFLTTSAIAVFLGIIGGYSGIRLISILSSKLEQRVEDIEIATNQLNEAFQRKRSELEQQLEQQKKDVEKQIAENKEYAEYLTAVEMADTVLYEKALPKLLRYSEAHPDLAIPLLWAGYVYKRMDEFDRAIECATQATQIEPTYWVAWYNLACYQALSGVADEHVIQALSAAAEQARSPQERKDLLKSLREDTDLQEVREKSEDFQLVIDTIDNKT